MSSTTPVQRIKNLILPTSSMFENQVLVIDVITEGFDPQDRFGIICEISGIQRFIFTDTSLDVIQTPITIINNRGQLRLQVKPNSILDDNQLITIKFPDFGIERQIYINDATVQEPGPAKDYDLELPDSTIFQNQEFNIILKSRNNISGLVEYLITGIEPNRINIPLTGTLQFINRSATVPVEVINSGSLTQMNISFPAINTSGSVNIA